MRMTTFIIGMIIVSLFITAFGLVLTNVEDEYGVTYEESDINSLSKMTEIQTLTENIKGRVENQTVDRGLADVIGGFIADGKDTLLLSAQSFGLFTSMTNSGMEKAGIPQIFSTTLYSIILIIIFIGIILGAILGKNL